MVDERQPTPRRTRFRTHATAHADRMAGERTPMAAAGLVADVASDGASRTATTLDPRDARSLASLTRRQPGGAYEVSDADLVRAIRAWNAREEREVVRKLCEVLATRCQPEFQRRSWGLRHQPQLMEDAISGMTEQLLREALDPSEEFMLMNFIHYLRCLCADNFSRVLRQEGLSYRRDAQGRPLGRPQHVPRALMDRIDVETDEHEEGTGSGRELAAREDPLGARLAALEAERILAYLPDPLDQHIMVLRALEHMRWDDIARLCGKTERTMRLRYEKARVLLRERILAEVE
ncbi:MAG: sigma-70 region 4 domain-containing protein [Ktedonobacterales bacterium]|nr:sigma-70 region 4 domain-containing protein [Ktedonobacterales bacterium]